VADARQSQVSAVASGPVNASGRKPGHQVGGIATAFSHAVLMTNSCDETGAGYCL
jgi:hypothetical protein